MSATDERYKPNTTQWEPGDFVLHSADAKRREMLMVVLGYAKNGTCLTVYLDANVLNRESPMRRTVWDNEISHLLDPKLFEINGANR